jgi:nicotinate-nucleotide pyrophosphorylase (carboxylating)
MNLQIKTFMQQTLNEDIGRGDLFALCITPKPATAHIIAKDDGVLAGVAYALALEALAEVKIDFHFEDGERLKKGDRIAVVTGMQTTLLAIERTLLNTLQHASGIATNAARYSGSLANSRIKLLDTRKTRPLLRVFEKYAARCGGVVNHRLGLDDALMLKDTHLKTIDDLGAFLAVARKRIPFTARIEIECETPVQAEAALKAGADIIMCDNMEPEQIREVVALRDALAPSTLIEVSGNITEERIREFEGIGIDAISSGSIVHQATWLDFSMKMK